jgi:hypothetical protein
MGKPNLPFSFKIATGSGQGKRFFMAGVKMEAAGPVDPQGRRPKAVDGSVPRRVRPGRVRIYSSTGTI